MGEQGAGGAVPDGSSTLPGGAELTERARQVLDAAWRDPGFTMPNPEVYPTQFLWDSCFHAVVWASLGRADRALDELTNLFAHQADDGFVPHMAYWHDPGFHADFWGRPGTSCVTQPPMYGHALAELARRGVEVPVALLAGAEAGLRFLLERRARTDDGLVCIVHPWESGCDDSPRWDSWCPGGWSPSAWRAVKGDLVEAIELDPVTGSPVASGAFSVGAAGFNALVAFNLAELQSLGVALDLAPPPVVTDDVSVPVRPSSMVPTSEALLGVLVDGDPATFALLRDPAAFGGACGPAQVHRGDPAFDPGRYWRGPAWPQLTYLFWVAARRHGCDDHATGFAEMLVRGAVRSGMAEYWHPDSGRGLGARPQSWAALAAVVV